MIILHILRTEPDDMVRRIIRKISNGEKNKTVPLFRTEIDYDKLLEDIFSSDRVISWW